MAARWGHPDGLAWHRSVRLLLPPLADLVLRDRSVSSFSEGSGEGATQRVQKHLLAWILVAPTSDSKQ